MDERRWTPQGADDDAVNGVDVDAVRAADRMVDIIAAGGTVDGDDALLRLLSAARAEADWDIPAPPVVGPVQTSDGAGATVTPLASRRRRAMRRAGGVAAVGGVSLTSLVVGSGVAAALVVGGFTVSALTTGNSGQSDSVVAGSAQPGEDGGSVDQDRRPAEGAERDPERGTDRRDAPSASPAPSEKDDVVDRGADAGGMVLAEPSQGADTPLPVPTDTTGAGGADGDGADGATELSETPGDAGVPGGPMLMAEPQGGAAAKAPASTSSSSSSSTSPSSEPKAHNHSEESEPAP
ncbi:hypothetical protein [Corynebacterium kalidii]|uniref:Uncharacterized protein n=1 Tax=Corynebacterium kalidii TaxID=2931982 RepID=A0A9X1WI92_9CORY|nr:hypothetical protein [Corynebacterium kalidii]MCJ7857920.1 hypothetical protein [Corynebacterium kalidii]